MAYNKSKSKGTAYETKIVKILTEHFKVGFKRMPLSGALEGLKGDIYSPKYLKEFPYAVEVKHYKEIKFNNLLTAKSHDIYSFWDQTTREAKEMAEFFGCEKKPLLIFRWDRSKNYCTWSDDIELTNQLTVKSFGYNFKIGLLDEWLKKCSIKWI